MLHQPPWSASSDFNPHTREGCDREVHLGEVVRLISIHTPVKGVTEFDDEITRHVVISIHTPVKGVTPDLTPASPGAGNFNPHTREGCDLPAQKLLRVRAHFNPHTREGCDGLRVVDYRQPVGISIHTPVKGVTRAYRGHGPSEERFQSTHP